MKKNYMISNDLMVMLVKHHVFGSEGYEEKIKKELERKMASIDKRNLYTKYKTAKTEEEREKNRKEYLDAVGMREDYRW